MSLFIEAIGGEITDRVSRTGWTQVHCPFGGHSFGDAHPSGAIAPDDAYFKCLGCSTQGDIFDLVIVAGKAKDFKGAIAWLEANAPTLG